MPKFFKAKILKSGTTLTNKPIATWFAIKGRGLAKQEIREFREYLNECAAEFLTEAKEEEDAPDTSSAPVDLKEGKRKTSEVASERKRPTWEEQTQENGNNGTEVKKAWVQSDAYLT